MLLGKEIIKIINEEVAKLISDMKENLSKSGKGDSALSNSIKSNVSDDGSVEVIMNDYGQFIDKGVTGKGDSDFKGKRKTIHKSKASFKFGSGNFRGTGDSWENKINKWMSSKGISGGKDKLGNFISKKSINYLIRRSIYQHGTRGNLFASNAFKGFQDQLYERLSNIDFTDIINTNGK